MFGTLDKPDDPDVSLPSAVSDEQHEGATRELDAAARKDPLLMTAKELDDYFFHFDRIVQGKENIFTPLSFGLVPVVIFKWEILSTLIIITAALVSTSLYYYMFRLIERFGYSQTRIWARLEQLRSTGDFRDVTNVPPGYSVRRSRRMLGVVLAAVWVLLIGAAIIQKGLG